MSNGTDASKPAVTAQGQNEVPLKAHIPDGQEAPDSFSGTATYTVTNNRAEPLNVLATASLEPPATAAADGAGQVPSGATAEVTPKKISLEGGKSAQAKVQVNVPAGPEPFTGVLKFVAKDELRHNEPGFSATYTSNVRTEAGKPDGNKWLLPVLIIVVLLVLAAAGFFAWKFFLSDDEPEVPPFAIPDVRTKPEPEAKAALENACSKPPCLEVVVEQQAAADPDVEIGNAIGTSPAAGQTTDAGEKVTLFVMRGFAIPEVKDLKEAAARARLETIEGCESPCFVVTTSKTPSLDIDAGDAISTSPDTGTQAKAKRPVTLAVSTGSPGVTLVNGQQTDLGFGVVPDIRFDSGPNQLVAINGSTFVASGPSTLTYAGCGADGSQKFSTGFIGLGNPNAAYMCVRTSGAKLVEVAVRPESTATELRLRYIAWPKPLFLGNLTILQQAKALQALHDIVPAGP